MILQTIGACIPREVVPGVDLKLCVQLFEDALDCVFADTQLACDFPIAYALPKALGCFSFPPGKRLALYLIRFKYFGYRAPEPVARAKRFYLSQRF